VRPHWLRLPAPVGDDPSLHAVLLTYASDYFLLDMAVRGHPDPDVLDRTASSSLDHAVWIHRPVRVDDWHLYVQEALAVVGHRGLVRGTFYDTAGEIVATAQQEVILQPATAAKPREAAP
jgi:acyl-CoA thioesterase-2